MSFLLFLVPEIIASIEGIEISEVISGAVSESAVLISGSEEVGAVVGSASIGLLPDLGTIGSYFTANEIVPTVEELSILSIPSAPTIETIGSYVDESLIYSDVIDSSTTEATEAFHKASENLETMKSQILNFFKTFLKTTTKGVVSFEIGQELVRILFNKDKIKPKDYATEIGRSIQEMTYYFSTFVTNDIVKSKEETIKLIYRSIAVIKSKPIAKQILLKFQKELKKVDPDDNSKELERFLNIQVLQMD